MKIGSLVKYKWADHTKPLLNLVGLVVHENNLQCLSEKILDIHTVEVIWNPPRPGLGSKPSLEFIDELEVMQEAPNE